MFAKIAPGMVLLVLTAATNADSNPIPESPISAQSLSADRVLSQSEQFVRPQTADELAQTARLLHAGGKQQQANQLLLEAQQAWLQQQQTQLASQPPSETGADQRERLICLLLQQSQYRFADELLREWRREDPRSTNAVVLQAISYYAQGQAELALRELRGMRGDVDPQSQGIVQLLNAFLQMQSTGIVPGVEANPWNVNFAVTPYEPGSLPAAEKSKLPEGIVEPMSRLIALLPTQGNLWGLYGELLNATGDPAGALNAFRLAKILQYYPRPLREHSRILEEHQQELARRMESQLAQAEPTPPEASDQASAESDQGVIQLASRSQVVIVVIIGGLLVLILFVLQIREWRKAARNKT